jgi:hypothetical protein
MAMFRPMKPPPPCPEIFAETLGFMTDYERDRMWHAAILLADSRGLLMRATAVFGRRIESLRKRLSRAGDRLGGANWGALSRRVENLVEDVLWNSFELSTAGLTAMPRFARPAHARGNTLHRIAASASGAASGFIGLPGVLFDIPFTTSTILRSIAEVARDCGEDLATEDTRRACLEVLAFGGPTNADDETEIGYWATRIGMNHLTVNMLIKSAAARFGLVLSEKFLAQTVPIAGAVSGAALNYAFTDYYQKMAQLHFTLRALDRRTMQPALLRASFTLMVEAARNRRRVMRKPPAMETRYLAGR